jgi:protein O-GlcNAc transferase
MTIEQTLEAALQHHQAGRIAQAQALYRQVLAQQPDQPDALHLLGVLAYQAGQPRTALDLVRRAVALNPAAPDFQINLGEILCATGRTDEAIAAYRAAARLSPRSAIAFNGLSIALLARGQLAEALDAAHRAIELQPDYPQAHNNLGNILHAQKELDSAIASYRRALALRPGFAQAANNLAVLLRDRGQIDEAITLLRDALAQNPDYADAHNNLGLALASAGRIDEAIDCYHRAVATRPAFAEAFNNLGNALHERGEVDRAQAAFQKALDLRPDFVEALLNLAKLLRESDLTDEAIATARAALVLRPDDPAALNQLALALGDRDQGDEAFRLLQRAVERSPQFDQAHNNLGNLYKDRGQLDQALASYDRAIALRPDRADYLGNRIFCMQYHPDLDAAAQRDYRQLWDQRHAQPLSGRILLHANDRSADRRLRIGYVSPDFREHCQSFFTLPLLRSHDHERFEIICYSSVRREDAVTQRLRGCADVWRSVAHLSDAQLADAIREDRIDILVDLTMHMAGGRLITFAAKPAPVQVTWLAYPGSTGLAAMDYRLTDPFLDPHGADESIYSERSLRLPDTFWCYDPLDDLAPSEVPASRQAGITFGCLNNFCKVNESVLKLWAAVLGKVAGSRLLILSPAGAHREVATATLGRHGVDASRIQWLDRRPRSKYLLLYHLVDICLDTVPYNGHTTSLDAMWMGVPVITRIGSTIVGRAGWSQLSNLNLTDLAAQTDEQFVTTAANLAADIPRLAELRRTLRQRMAASPLMDAPRFARNVEDAYRQMWQTWCGGGSARP